MRSRCLILVFILTLCPLALSAQYENVWTFGNGAGLDFNGGPPAAFPAAWLNGSRSMGPASVCDAQGQLLFYTDGYDLWGRNGVMMPNGENLTLNTGSTNNPVSMSLIVPFPDSADMYYVFSLKGGYGLMDPAVHGQLFYSVVDMRLNGGMGDVVPGRKGALLSSNLAGRLTAVPGTRCNVWVLVQDHPDVRSQFRAFEINREGINPAPVISGVSNYAAHGNSFEDIAVSPDGRRIATSVFTYLDVSLELFDFDPATGAVTNTALRISRRRFTGVAFSPDNSMLYSHSYVDDWGDGSIYQFDLDSTSPRGVKISPDSIKGLLSFKRGPDGKIYFRSVSSTRILGAIRFPDLPGIACGYEKEAVHLLTGTSVDEKFPNVVPVIRKDTVTRSSVISVCFEDSLDLDPDPAGWNYRWENGDTGRRRTVRNPGSYTVSYYRAPCVYHLDTLTVSFRGRRPGIFTVTGCAEGNNSSARVQPAAGDTTTYHFTWKNQAGQTIRSHSGADGDTLQAVAPGAYTVLMEAGPGCAVSFPLTIDPPGYRSDFTADTAVCHSDSVRFRNLSSPGDFVSYSWDFGDGTVSADPDPVHLYRDPGVYTVRLTGRTAYPCYDTAYRDVVVMKWDTVSDGRERIACFADSLVLEAPPGGYRYLWENGDTSVRRVVRTSGLYRVSYFSDPCVYHTDSVSVVFKGKMPRIEAVAGCKEGNGTVRVQPVPGDTTLYVYSWTNAGGQVIRSYAGRSGDTLTGIAPGAYAVAVSAGECSVSLAVNLGPPGFRILFDADTVACQADSIRFYNTSSPGDFVSWMWDFGDGSVSAATDPVHRYMQPGTYTVRLTGETTNSCHDTVFREIRLDTLPVVYFRPDRDSICAGEQVVLHPFSTDGADAMSWLIEGQTYPSAGQAHVRTFDSAGIYIIRLLAEYPHCPDTSFSGGITVFPYPQVDLGADRELCPHARPVQLANLLPDSAVSRLWSTGSITSSIPARAPGIYWLRLTSARLCSAADTIVIRKSCYLDIPNVFTPNGDGLNDYFIPGILSSGLSAFRMQVFNRWGQLLYKTAGKDDPGWDGTLDGAAQPGGVYIYLIEADFADGTSERYQGNITLLR